MVQQQVTCTGYLGYPFENR